MKFLITGSTGFIGTWLMKILPNAIGLSSKDCDIRDYDKLKEIILNKQPTHIIHLAGIANPIVCEKNPRLAWEINVIGSKNILEIGKQVNSKVILFSSAKVYENGINLKEDSKLKKDGNVYVKTKLEIEKLGKDATIIRPFNQEGPGRGKDYFTTKAITSALHNHKLELWNPSEVREFMDIRDGVEGIKLISLKGEKGIYNLSSGEGISKLDYLMVLEKTISKKINYEVIKDEKRSLVGNNEKLKALGWKRRYSLKDTIKAQIDYLNKTN